MLPHVYSASSAPLPAMSLGGRYALPEGTTREIGDVRPPSDLEVEKVNGIIVDLRGGGRPADEAHPIQEE